MPIVDLKLSHLCTLPYQSIRIVQKFVEILVILGLTCHCSKCFMPDNRLFFLVFDAFPDQMFLRFAAYLPKDETYLMLEQTGLSLVVLLWQQLGQHFDAFLSFSVTHQVHYPVFVEERNIFPQEQRQKSTLLVYLLQLVLTQEFKELLFVVGSSWLFCLEIVLAVSGFEMDISYLFHCDFTGPSQFIALRMNMLGVKLFQLGQEIVGQCFSCLMSW